MAKTRVKVVFYSMYGHVYRLAEAVAAGAREVAGTEVVLEQVAELIPAEALERTGAAKARAAFQHVPVADPAKLVDADAILFGTPTRFGMMCAQMRNFLDQTGKLWAEGSLIGKVGSVFCSTATQHGGQEATLLSFHTTLLHHGMVVVGLPYSFQGQMSFEGIVGCAPYGATTLAGPDGSRQPSATDLDGAKFQGRHVAEIARRLKATA